MKLLSLTLLLFTYFFFSTSPWEEFTSPDGQFRVLVPGQMEMRTNTIQTEIGEMRYVTYIYQAADEKEDNLVYMISYCDYPDSTIHSDSTDLLKEFFDTTIETATKSVEGELVYSSEIGLDRFPGRLWRIDYNNGTALIKTKAYVVGQRYYSLQAITVKTRSMNTLMDKFLDSFSLLNSSEN